MNVEQMSFPLDSASAPDEYPVIGPNSAATANARENIDSLIWPKAQSPCLISLPQETGRDIPEPHADASPTRGTIEGCAMNE